MFNELTFDNIITLFNMLIIPLFVWMWKTDRRTLQLEIELNSLKNFQVDLLTEFKTLIIKLDEIKDEIHKSFVSQRSCDFRHNNHNKS